MTKRILVTGGTGNVGGLVARRLVAKGILPRVLARDPAKARAKLGMEVDIVPGDLDVPESLDDAFAGVDVVLGIGVDSAVEAHDAAILAAVKWSTTARLVKLSSLDARREAGDAVGAWHARSEAALRASGVPFTIVRPAGFMSNALAWAGSIKGEGVVKASTGDGKVAMIDPADIADVCVEVLLRDDLAGATIPITGPAALGYASMVAILGRAIGKELRFVPIDDAEAKERLLAFGRSEAVADALVALWRAVREGKVEVVTNAVERVLGRPARSFEAWAAENAAVFA